jgi:hypothetical protein
MNATDIMFHIPRLWIRSLKVHDSHLADFGLKWNRHIHTQLSRWLDGHILQNGVGEVLSLSWRSISGIEGINNISWVAAEREKAARVSRVLLRVMHYLPFSVSASVAARPGDIEEREEHTTKWIVPIHLWPGLGVWTAGHPGELDMESGVRGGCEVDVDAEGEGEQNGDCGKEGHGGQRVKCSAVQRD